MDNFMAKSIRPGKLKLKFLCIQVISLCNCMVTHFFNCIRV